MRVDGIRRNLAIGSLDLPLLYLLLQKLNLCMSQYMSRPPGFFLVSLSDSPISCTNICCVLWCIACYMYITHPANPNPSQILYNTITWPVQPLLHVKSSIAYSLHSILAGCLRVSHVVLSLCPDQTLPTLPARSLAKSSFLVQSCIACTVTTSLHIMLMHSLWDCSQSCQIISIAKYQQAKFSVPP